MVYIRSLGGGRPNHEAVPVGSGGEVVVQRASDAEIAVPEGLDVSSNQGDTAEKGLTVDPAESPSAAVPGWSQRVNGLQSALERHPWFQLAKDHVGGTLEDSKAKSSLLRAVASRSGGVFSYAASVFGGLISSVLNVVLTAFFFSFFLQRIAIWHDRQQEASPEANHHVGEYLVTVLFESRWLPNLDRETKEEAQDIVTEVFSKLAAWVKGYMSIILVEAPLYVLIFMILGLPYAVPLGIIAGLTVLLPFIGPIISCVLTLLVYIGIGGEFSLTIAILTVTVYFGMNTIEQLVLYPRLIGDRLGLNSLETIVVVLLGGLFAGLSGMIFAIPTAAILKFLVPKCYRCWQT